MYTNQPKWLSNVAFTQENQHWCACYPFHHILDFFCNQNTFTTMPFIAMDQDDGIENKAIDPEIHSGEFQLGSTRLPPHKQNRDESNGPAEWLLWPKTRDEFFGVGVSVWDENWAAHLIFDRDAAAKQLYLWDTLSAGKHYQFGMGLLKIPKGRRRGLSFIRRAKTRSDFFYLTVSIVEAAMMSPWHLFQ